MMNFGRVFRLRNTFKIATFTGCVLLFSACAMPFGSSTDSQKSRSSSEVPKFYRNGTTTAVLMFSGPSTWTAEAKQIAAIIRKNRVSYKEVGSEELNAMPLEELLTHSLMLVPGGYAPDLSASLTSATRARIRHAVQVGGMDYLGFCAGAWVAISPAPVPPNEDVTYGIGVVDGPIQEYNYLYNRGLEFALSEAIFPNGKRQNLLWFGGPITPEIPGGVIARYADGTPAITQINSGRGLVIVSGFHPAINSTILNAMHLEGPTAPEAIDHGLAWRLIHAGIWHSPLPTF